MKFSSFDLHQQPKGALVQVQLSGSSANVRLFDSLNFRAFKAGRKATGYGGHVKRSPARLTVPRPGHWFVVVDHGGLPGNTRAKVEVLPGALPALRQTAAPSLDRLRESVADINHDDGLLIRKDWDVFVSHASEDKEDVVRPLAAALRDLGLQVWYDEFELKMGDSLRRKIDQGIACSTFGVVVFSEAFFSKKWTNHELDGLVTRAVDGQQILLPIWHKVTKSEVMAYSPSLADRLGRSTTDFTLDEISEEIATIVRAATSEQARDRQ